MKPISAKALFGDLWPAAPAGVLISSVVTDSREATPGSVFVAIKGERVDGHDFAEGALERGALYVVASRSMENVPADRTVLVGDVLDAMIEMGAHYREGFSPLMLGITGSIGKTTTKEFCAAIFSAFGETLKTSGNQNNEIGMPNTLFRLNDDTRYAVVEMGMQKLGEIRKLSVAAKPSGAVITKIAPVHLATAGSIENILAAKMEICAGLPSGAPLVLNGDDGMLRGVKVPEGVHPVYVGVENEDNEVKARDIFRERDGTRFRIKDARYGEFDAAIPALGDHNVVDALLAYTAATRLGLSPSQSALALRRYQVTGLRQDIQERDGVVWIEDCYNAAPDSMKAALNVLRQKAGSRRMVAVLGDMLELGPIEEAVHKTLGDDVADLGVSVLITVGDLAALAAEQAKARGVNAVAFRSNEEAIAALQKTLKRGDTVLVKASRGMHFEEILAGVAHG